MNPLLQIFRLLPGTWQFQRTISIEGPIVGTATFRRAEKELETLLYREDGILTKLTGEVQKVYRNYIYRWEDNTVKVYFDDNRPFHTLRVVPNSKPLQAEGDHLCKCDIYKATYTFFEDGLFQLHYAINGPQKNYTITTHFTKNL